MNGATALDSVVCSSNFRTGGTKSLYAVCEWLDRLGRCSIASHPAMRLATWFQHRCRRYDYSYHPSVLVYPELFQQRFEQVKHHVCFALGQTRPIEPHADLVVCKSPEVQAWVRSQHPGLETAVVDPSIDRSVFEYDGRPKRDQICFMKRGHKHPETLDLLRERYGDRVVEIAGRTEAEVAELLREARVFVWRGAEKEGSPRPPKEALVAGCVVVGLVSELHAGYGIDFGVRCADVDELVRMAGEALKMSMPTLAERAVVRDKTAEEEDWRRLMQRFVDGTPSAR